MTSRKFIDSLSAIPTFIGDKERQVEHVYNDMLIDAFPGIQISNPYKCDGYFETDMDKDVTTTIDDKDIKEKYENTIFIELGYNPVYEKMSILSIPMEKKEDALVELKRAGCRSVKILHTDNLSSARLKHIPISEIGHDSHMLDDNQYNHVYGPFEEVETIDLTKLKIDENSERKVGHGQFRPFIVKVLSNGDINYTT